MMHHQVEESRRSTGYSITSHHCKQYPVKASTRRSSNSRLVMSSNYPRTKQCHHFLA
uniref:Uncharacterized protein n=1 Tax=Rhizophora mucronata TaxID=61149 RepID=A0A2P2NEK6_RHIMU